MQAIGVRANGTADDLDGRLVKRLVRSSPYVAGVALDAVGFGLSFAALRTMPLFAVQAIIASSLAVTALMSIVLLGLRPAVWEWLAVMSVTAGLTLLALSAADQSPTRLDEMDRWLLVISVVGVGAFAFVTARRRRTPGRHDGWVLGVLAGLMFGAAGIGARILRTPTAPWRLFVDPAFYAMALAGILGLLIYAMAVQRGRVTVATAAVVVSETLVPALVGITLLGDRPARGHTTLAAVGFALTVCGAVALARYGDPPVPSAERYGDLSIGTLPAP
jgi:drug/metabolite transporter (DMT)-like permease